MRAEPAITVIQGFHRVVTRQDVALHTLLGSCVAACLWDAGAEIGGMNHFLLPPARSQGEAAENMSRGVHAMELLINDLLKAGARRRCLEAKLFGGACIRTGLTDVGEQNAAFAEGFLRDEGIPLAGGSLRGARGRRVQFWPMSGRARQSLIALDPASSWEAPAPRTVAPSGDLELF